MRSASGVLISVCDEPGQCPICGGPWHVQKTVPHHGKTISHGQFEIRETIHVCAAGCRYASGGLVTRRAVSLAHHIIPDRTVGYDVMVFVGLQRFVHHRQREEIRSTLLDEYGISLSSGTISNVAELFLQYMQDLHYKHAQRLRNALAEDGGWPLHIDATCEDGRGTLLVALAGWRRWVLGSWKVPTERSDVILPCLHQIVEMFGAPCAVMRDLGRAITLAVNTFLAELDLDIPVLACHLHFLKDIGFNLSGGFAYYGWYGGKHAGDFVFTIGGYHPEYKVPANYPKAPRLDFGWQVIPFDPFQSFNIKGEVYFALVPTAIMAGGYLKATYSLKVKVKFDIGICGASLSAKLLAYLIVNANFIISWQPFYYKADIYLQVGIKAVFRGKAWFSFGFKKISKSVKKSFDLSLSAGLKIWGPEFAGIAHVDWKIISFDIEFGKKSEIEPKPLTWGEFRRAFLPDNAVCTVAVEDGLTNRLEDGTFVIDPAELILSTNSMIPSKSANEGISGKGFGIGSMKVQSVSGSTHMITITDTDANKDVTDDFVFEPIFKNAPEAMWGSSFEAKLNSGAGLIKDMLMGCRVMPKPKKKPDETEDKRVKDFSYDIELKDNAYIWTEPLKFRRENSDNDEARRNAIQGIGDNTARGALLKDLGLDAGAVDLGGFGADTADAFLVAPQVLKAA